MADASVSNGRRRRAVKAQSGSRRWVTTLVATIAVAAVAVAHAVLAHQMRVPIIYADELGYIENARYLIRGGQRPALTYYPGLSLFLLPAWAVTTHALAVWRSAQAVNGAAAVVTLVEVVALGTICGLTRLTRWLVAIAVAAYPPVLLYGDVALSESLFQAAFVGVVLLVVAAARPGTSSLRWAPAGGAVALLTLVHPRGLAVVIALLIVAVITMWPVWRHGLGWLSLVAGLVLGFAVLRVALVSTRATNIVTRSDYQAGAVVSRNLSGHSVGQLIVGLFGRAFYLSVATAGLAPFAIVLGMVGLVAVIRGDRSPLRLAQAFSGLAGLGVLALSVLLVNGGTRADELVHGRYVDGIVAPLLVIALAEVIGDPRRRWKLWAAAGIATLVVSGAVLAVAGQIESLSGELNAINILGIEPLLRRLDGDRLRLLPLMLAGGGAILAGALIARRTPRVAVLLLAVAFAASAIDTQHNYLVPGSTAKARQTVLVDAIQHATTRLGVAPGCVSYDGELDFNYFADRFLLGTQPIQAINPGDRPCGVFVITSRPAFENRFPGSRLVVDEDDVNEDLYVLPGPAQQVLANAGWLLPNLTPGPLPLGSQLARITTRSTPITVHSGGATHMRARVTNASDVSPWPALRGIKQGPYAVRVAVRWFAANQQATSPGQPGTPLVSTAVELPRSLLPGDSATVRLPLVARLADGRPLPPAQYVVRVAVYQELAGSFGGAINLNVRVSR